MSTTTEADAYKAAYSEIDDMRGTGAIRAVSPRGTEIRLCVDGRFYDQHNRRVPFDAHGPWTITATHAEGL